ncbi:MAG: hypothetical protein V4580_06540 [Bacteroidota bacterium]
MQKNRHTINVLIVIFLHILTGGLFIDLWWFSTNAVMQVQHYLCVLLPLATLVMLFINHNLFNLMLGITLVIGNFGGLSCFHEISTSYVGFHIGPLPIPLYYGQPLYSVLLLIYMLFNKEFYIGLVTKEYWQGFLHRTKDLEQVITIVKAKATEAEHKKNENIL